MRTYFRELLATLKEINESLKVLVRCVRKGDNHRNRWCIVTGHWNDS